MSGDYCSGLFGHSPWQIPACSYRDVPFPHDLSLIGVSIHPADDIQCYSNLCPALCHCFTTKCHQLLNGQLQPMSCRCFNSSLLPRSAICHDCLNAGSYDCPSQLKKLELGAPIPEQTSLDKKFIVFGQSGSQRSVFISSMNSFSPLTFEYANKTSTNGPPPPLPRFSRDVSATADHISDQSSWEESQILMANDDSEMHENTEDLEALLCSDDADADEVTSTGHSPIIVTAGIKKGRDDNISTYTAPLKKRKMYHGRKEQGIGEPLADTGTSVFKSPKSTDPSHIGDPRLFCSGDYLPEESHSLRGSNRNQEGEVSSVAKKMRKEKIRKTVSILRSILPACMQKDATMVLGDAIQYLRSLKLKLRSLEP